MMPAIAAAKPESASTASFTAPVRSPTARAALSFEPVAMIHAPAGVSDIRPCPSSTTSSAIRISTGTP